MTIRGRHGDLPHFLSSVWIWSWRRTLTSDEYVKRLVLLYWFRFTLRPICCRYICVLVYTWIFLYIHVNNTTVLKILECFQNKVRRFNPIFITYTYTSLFLLLFCLRRHWRRWRFVYLPGSVVGLVHVPASPESVDTWLLRQTNWQFCRHEGFEPTRNLSGSLEIFYGPRMEVFKTKLTRSRTRFLKYFEKSTTITHRFQLSVTSSLS